MHEKQGRRKDKASPETSERGGRRPLTEAKAFLRSGVEETSAACGGGGVSSEETLEGRTWEHFGHAIREAGMEERGATGDQLHRQLGRVFKNVPPLSA